MARSNARLIRFTVLVASLLVCGFILSRGSGMDYIPTTKDIEPEAPLVNHQQESSNIAASGSKGSASDFKGSASVSDSKDSVSSSEKSTSYSSSSGSGSGSGKKVSKVVDGFKKTFYEEPPVDNSDKVKATFVTLARNTDLESLTESIRHIEDRFNRKFNYDWVFLNDEEFTEEFKTVTSALVSGTTKYGKIGKEHWGFPEWIDLEKAAKARETMREKKVIYGDSIPYRHMCRYESGFFFRHPLMMDYEYYWRVEPDVKIFCDINYDIFKFMKENNKVYGWTISLPEYIETVPTLWDATKEFIKENPQYLPENNMLDFVSDDGGATYNLCHFWSNFEVGSLAFWRSEAYIKYFEHLDKAGGFFYERWGDAPVHSIAAALFLPRDQIHFFGDLGYYHIPFYNCPVDKKVRLENKCVCDVKNDFTWKDYSCTKKYHAINNLKRPENWKDYSG